MNGDETRKKRIEPPPEYSHRPAFPDKETLKNGERLPDRDDDFKGQRQRRHSFRQEGPSWGSFVDHPNRGTLAIANEDNMNEDATRKKKNEPPRWPEYSHRPAPSVIETPPKNTETLPDNDLFSGAYSLPALTDKLPDKDDFKGRRQRRHSFRQEGPSWGSFVDHPNRGTLAPANRISRRVSEEIEMEFTARKSSEASSSEIGTREEDASSNNRNSNLYLGPQEFNAPVYQEDWDDTYMAETYQPLAIRLASGIGAFLTLGKFALGFAADPGLRGEWGGIWWGVVHFFPLLVISLVSVFVSFLFGLPNLKPFCIRQYDLLCALWLFCSYVCILVFSVLWDLRNIFVDDGKYHHSENATRSSIHYENVTFAINMVNGWWPVRNCSDLNPEGQLLVTTQPGFPPGCSSALADGQTMSLLCLLCFVCPILLKLSAQKSRILSASQMLAYAVVCIFSGYTNFTAIWCWLLQATLSISATLLCDMEEKREQANFAVLMAIRFASTINRDLLHTLIPPNVFRKLTTDDEPHKAQHIPVCTVMFATIDYEVSTAEEFNFINSLFTALDEAVEQSGMFKYQHVCSNVTHNYIVTCPRVSTPYETPEDYPYAQYYTSMIALGFELMRITENVTRTQLVNLASGQPQDICMKVGISSGPAACVVLGKIRKFFCVYGDRINTASRMCKYSEPHKIRVTPDIGSHVGVAGDARFDSKSHGIIEIKGKGPMEVYDVSKNRVSFSLKCSVDGPLEDFAGSRHLMPDLKEKHSHAGLVLESENLDAWITKGHTLETFWPRFRSPELEHTFLHSNKEVLSSRWRLTTGILCHLTVCVWLWRVVVNPDHDSYFSHYENAQLKTGMIITQALLVIQFVVALGFSCVILFLLRYFQTWAHALQRFRFLRNCLPVDSDHGMLDEHSQTDDPVHVFRSLLSSPLHPQHTIRIFEGIFILLKITMLFTGLYLSTIWPSRRSQLIFISLIGQAKNFGFGLCGFGLSFEGNLFLVLLSLPASYLAVSLSTDATGGWVPEFSAGELVTAVSSVLFSRAFCINKRFDFRLDLFHRQQFDQLQKTLFDLLPKAYVQHLIEGCKYIESSPGRAVVLQLDLCNFTVISQTMPPAKLADILNALIQDFDEIVIGHNLTKIDTIGDAYNVVSWLPCAAVNANESIEDEHARCLGMLTVADGLLSVLTKHRILTGIELHGRIGIATGNVICGVVGRLQPRFCVFGESIRLAAELEQAGTKGAVHCSTEFIDNVMCVENMRRRRMSSYSAELADKFVSTYSAELDDKFKRVDKHSSVAAKRIFIKKMMDEKRIVVQQDTAMLAAIPSLQSRRKSEIERRKSEVEITILDPALQSITENLHASFADVATERSRGGDDGGGEEAAGGNAAMCDVDEMYISYHNDGPRGYLSELSPATRSIDSNGNFPRFQGQMMCDKNIDECGRVFFSVG